MRRRNTILWAAVALLALALTACGNDIELNGSAWSNYTTGIDEEGDQYKVTYTMVCNEASSGMLFVNVDYGEPMSFCFALPFGYTWDGGQGKATVLAELAEEEPMQFSIPLSWSKTTGLQASFGELCRALELPDGPLELVQQSFSKPASMVGTTWTVEFDDDIDHIVYELQFVSATAAVLTGTMTEGEARKNARWNINYSYADGVGTTNIYSNGENVQGGFYMPDGNHLFFCDGENGLLFNKQ